MGGGRTLAQQGSAGCSWAALGVSPKAGPSAAQDRKPSSSETLPHPLLSPGPGFFARGPGCLFGSFQGRRREGAAVPEVSRVCLCVDGHLLEADAEYVHWLV